MRLLTIVPNYYWQGKIEKTDAKFVGTRCHVGLKNKLQSSDTQEQRYGFLSMQEGQKTEIKYLPHVLLTTKVHTSGGKQNAKLRIKGKT
jgi:hypothetical protein